MTTAVAGVGEHAAPDKKRPYAADSLSLSTTMWAIVAAAVSGGVCTLAGWWLIKQTSLPAFNTSMVTRTLATAGTTLVLLVVGALVFWWLCDDSPRPRWRSLLTYVALYLSPAAIVLTTVALPLSATRLYLNGLQVDQAFRTQFLTRTAETWSNQDMNYIDLPTYYPLGWFWLGGRLANILDMPGWAVYQPWSIVSLAIAGCVLVPVWQRITGSLPVGAAIALVTTCVTLVSIPEEPYAAIIAMGVPAVCMKLRAALTGSWPATLVILLFFGMSALFYTLFTAVVALAVTLIAVILAFRTPRWWVPLVHLVVIGAGSIAIALVSWGPFLLRALTSSQALESTANHFLPKEGTVIPLPFLAPSVIGVLCFIGLVYFIARIKDHNVRIMVFTTLVFYGWALASMLTTLLGTTLLGFRINILIVLMMTTAGVLALSELRHTNLKRFYPQQLSEKAHRGITVLGIIVLIGSGLIYAQDIPSRNETAIDQAYSDTDGYGERADQYVPDATSSYAEIADTITGYGWAETETVVLTDENFLLSFYPFFGFNAFTSHYANPLGEFSQRNAEIARWADESWSSATDPAEFRALLNDTPWHAPDVFVFRGADAENLDDSWKMHIAEDIYPSQPNIRHVPVYFNPRSFDDPELWHIDQVGPFVVVTAVQQSTT